MANTKRTGPKRSGSLYWTKSGWRARLRIDVDGVTVQKSFDLETRDKVVARAKLRRLVKQNATPEELASEAARPDTFEEIARRYCEDWEKGGMAMAGDRLHRLKAYAFPAIGTTPPAEIRAAEILGLLEAVRDEGKSRQTMIHVKGDVSAVLGKLWRAELLPENVCARVLVPDALPEVAERAAKERAVLTDDELVVYLRWEHPDENFREAVRERQVMSVLARTFGGLRTGDEHALTWEMFDTSDDGAFAWGYAPRRKGRKKGGKPQKLAIPDIAKPILWDWWKSAGKPTSGAVFPVRRGKRAGEHREGGSHADAFRRDLRRAFGIDELTTVVKKRKNRRPLTWKTWKPVRKLTARERVLLETTNTTLPVDFHSWRRAYNQALADANVNAQQAQALAGHASLSAHERYLRNSQKMRVIPAEALPRILLATAPNCASPMLNSVPENQNNGSGWQDLNLQQPAPKALTAGISKPNESDSAITGPPHDRRFSRSCSGPCTDAMHRSAADCALREYLANLAGALGAVVAKGGIS